ncbi:MAG: hypothetical protein U5K51_11730 [Flavobacteriaceae bacterium]|nr:hypothetical protein [Flavobacteriaceae bacterium]
MHSFSDGRITDTGPLTKKRMETIDEEVNVKAMDFMERAKKADKPFFFMVEQHKNAHIYTPCRRSGWQNRIGYLC